MTSRDRAIVLGLVALLAVLTLLAVLRLLPAILIALCALLRALARALLDPALGGGIPSIALRPRLAVVNCPSGAPVTGLKA